MTALTGFVEEHGARLLRYAGVSVIGVITGQSLLVLFYKGVGLGPTAANVVAVAIGTIPSYMLNRAWVWGRTGSHSLRAEIAPFWFMAFLGLALSTLLVHLAHQRTDSWVVINGANLVAFGSLWVAKYFLLDRVLFRADQLARVESTA